MLRSFLIYGIGGAASRLAAVFLVPLYTRALNVSEYGTLELLLALHMGAVLLAGLQSESAILRDYFSESTDHRRNRLVWSGAAISLGGAAILGVLALLAADLGAVPREIAPFIPELLALTVLAQLLGIQLVVLRCAERPTFFAAVALLDFALAALASAVLILHIDLGVRGALWGMACGKLAGIALAYSRTFGMPPKRFLQRRLIARMLAYALPTLPSVLFNWAQTNGARVLLAAFFTLQDVAIVGVAMRVSAIFGFIIQSFRLAWEPHAFRNLDGRSTDPQFYDRALQLYSVPMLLAAGFAMAAGPLLVAAFAPRGYASAIPLVGYFIAGQFWLGALSILTMGIHGARVTGKLTYITGLGALTNAALLLLLSPWLGTLSAAVGFFASTIAAAALAARYSNRHYSTGFKLRRLLALGAISGVLATSAYALAAPVDFGSFDWFAYTWRAAALLAVLTACLGALIADLDTAIRSALSHRLASIASRLRL